MSKRSAYISSGRSDDSWYEERKRKEAERAKLMKKIGEYTVEDVLKIHNTMLQQDQLLERLTKAGVMYSRVIDFDLGHPVLSGGIKVEPPDFDVNIGDWVIVSEETRQIVELCSRSSLGELVTITRVVDSERAEVGSLVGSRLLRYPRGADINSGEEWLASGEGILVEKIARPNVERQTDYNPVYWDDIGGLDEIKRDLQESIKLLRGDTHYFAYAYNMATPKGVLLYGPPGNGKTMLGRAVATELSGSSQQFLYIKGPEILSKFVGQSEERIRILFSQARECSRQSGFTSVIFIDECDAIMNVRGSGRSSDVERTIVPAFLTEMDGLEQSRVFIMLATNRPDTLDPAIIREGRIDQRIFVGHPDRDAVTAIFKRHLSNLPCVDECSLAEAVTDHVFGNSDISGAFCVAVIEKAKRLALHRDLDRGFPQNGIQLEDLISASNIILESRK